MALLVGGFGVGVAAALMAVEMLFTGHGLAAGQQRRGKQRNRNKALHRQLASPPILGSATRTVRTGRPTAPGRPR